MFLQIWFLVMKQFMVFVVKIRIVILVVIKMSIFCVSVMLINRRFVLKMNMNGRVMVCRLQKNVMKFVLIVLLLDIVVVVKFVRFIGGVIFVMMLKQNIKRCMVISGMISFDCVFNLMIILVINDDMIMQLVVVGSFILRMRDNRLIMISMRMRLLLERNLIRLVMI